VITFPSPSSSLTTNPKPVPAWTLIGGGVVTTSWFVTSKAGEVPDVSPLLVAAILSQLARFGLARPQLTVNASEITGVVTLLVLLLAPFIYAAFKAVEWRWWLSGIRFGDVRFEATLSRGALIGLYWKVIGWLVLISVAFGGYLYLCMQLVVRATEMPMDRFLASGGLQGNILVLVLVGIGYLPFVLLFNVVMRVYLMRDVWVRLVGSTQVHGLAAVANVSVRGDLASAIGEGFADGLDVVGF